MKYLLAFVVALSIPAYAQHHAHETGRGAKKGESVQFTYDQLELPAGKATVEVISQHGLKFILPAEITMKGAAYEVSFTLPADIAKDEWQVFSITENGVTVKLQTVFMVNN